MLYSNAVIDWVSVLMNSFWIVGTAVLLAAFSYQYAQTQPTSLKERLSQPSFLRSFWLGFTCIAVGLAGTSQTAWEAGLWSIFVLIGLLNIVKRK
jgi:hypothetical protein